MRIFTLTKRIAFSPLSMVLSFIAWVVAAVFVFSLVCVLVAAAFLAFNLR